MRALDAGAGTGAVARVMAQLVGPEGHVTALDISEPRLSFGRGLAEAQGITNLEFCQDDLYAPTARAGSFDFVWCRFVFEYLDDPDRALASLIRLARPGGVVVVGDIDGNGLFGDPLPESLRAGIDRLRSILEPRFDFFAGRKLFGRFARAGLRQIQVHFLPFELYAGAMPERELPNWRDKLGTIRQLVLQPFGGAEAYDRFAEEYLAFLRDPQTLSYSVLFLVQGTRP